MKIDFMTALSLITALNMELNNAFKDKQLTIGELYDIIGAVIEKLNLKDQVIFEKDK